jgi:hypothetical protein
MASGTSKAQTVRAAMVSGCNRDALYFGSQVAMGKNVLSVRLLFWRVRVVVVIGYILFEGKAILGEGYLPRVFVCAIALPLHFGR